MTNTFFELQAVILAGNFEFNLFSGCTGERLYPMNSQSPICLLPVSQKPMIYYVIVVVQKHQMKFFTKYYSDFYKGNVQVQFEQVEVRLY
jgi:dTDP-glucose pyrophosphorylase